MDTDPIQYPTIQLGNEIFVVKFRVGDIIRLKKEHQIELGEMTTLKGAEAFEQMLILLQAGIAHQAKKTVDELADLVDLAEFPVYTDAVTQALKKASPRAAEILNRQKAEAALAQAPATTQ